MHAYLVFSLVLLGLIIPYLMMIMMTFIAKISLYQVDIF